MRTIVLILTIVAIAVGGVRPVQAQVMPRTLVDETIRLGPGATADGAFVLEEAGALIVTANSPPGRTGCDATLILRRSVSDSEWVPLTILITPLELDALKLRYPGQPGRYEYTVSATNCPVPAMSRDDPAYAYKIIGLIVTTQSGID